MTSIAQYIRLLYPDGSEVIPADARSYQNFFVGESRDYGGRTYAFAPFAIGGDTSSSGESNASAELAMPANLLTGSAMWEAAEGRFLLRVLTVTIATQTSDPPTFVEQSTIGDEIWLVNSFAYADKPLLDEGDSENDAVILTLSNTMSAVAGTAPLLYLNSSQVGSLPYTGSLLL